MVELSPFVTSVSTDKGYVATSSLAGSRVNTALKDIAAQIDVMTVEFLNDIAATNMDEAVAFSTNNGTPADQNVDGNNGIVNTRAVGRARGFDAITQSADFYETYLPSEFYNMDRLNLFAGRRLDQFKSFLIDPKYLVRGDQTTAGDGRGLYTPLSQTDFEADPSLDDDAATYSYGAVLHATRWFSVFGSKSDNTSLPQGFLDTENNLLPGVASDGYDFGFRTSLRDDSISMRVNFYKEHQKNLIGDGQAVREASDDIEQRLRGSDRPAGIANVPADGFDPVTRGAGVYRSIEDKIGRGIDVTLVARITSNWDARIAVGQQKTYVYNKGADFHRWVERRLPVWQSFGGLGWDNVTISPTDSRTVHQYYDQDVAAEILRDQLRNALPRFRQRVWRANLFTNYRFTEGGLKGLNLGGGVRWFDQPITTGYYQRVFPNGQMGDDVTRPIPGVGQTFVDLLLGYGGRTKFFGGRRIGWRVQLNIRNVLDNDDIEPIRSHNYTAEGLHWGRVEPRQFILTTSFTF